MKDFLIKSVTFSVVFWVVTGFFFLTFNFMSQSSSETSQQIQQSNQASLTERYRKQLDETEALQKKSAESLKKQEELLSRWEKVIQKWEHQASY